jgi:hypothetical protein
VSKLALPPLLSLPPASQAAFRAIAAWANTIDSGGSSSQHSTRVSGVGGSAITMAQVSALVEDRANSVAQYVVTRSSEDMVRSVIENSGTLPPIIMNAPQVFVATGRDGVRDYALAIGAGGLIGAYKTAGAPDTAYVHTFAVETDSGSFFFGAADAANTSDPAHRQIVFDATNNVITFGSSIVIQRSDGQRSPLDDIPWDANNYTVSDLEADLAAGVGSVLAGSGGDFVLEANAENGWIVLKHKDLQFPTGGSYSGTLRTGMGITANGIFMGYQPRGGGAFVNTVSIDGATGNATFKGEVRAESVISVNAFIGSTLAGTVVSGAAAGLIAQAGLQDIRLNPNGTLSGGGGGAVTIQGIGYTGDLNATRNKVSYSATEPASPIDGDLWCDTGIKPAGLENAH